MALLNILKYPDPRLKKRAQALEAAAVTAAPTKHIIQNMFETMYNSNGVGLAATQVDIHLQIITIDVSEARDQPLCLINPKIIDDTAPFFYNEEGCLSFPGVFAKVKRHQKIVVQFLEPEGKTKSLAAEGLLSICIQHEIDHLNGITFFDHLSPLKRQLLEKKLTKIAKQKK